MAKAKVEKKAWTIFPSLEQVGPGTPVTQENVKNMRDGLAHFYKVEGNSDLVKTLAYRSLLDLDHLLRLLQSTPGSIIATYTFKVTPKDKKSAKKLAEEMSRGAKWTKTK